jgi:hypothetical protein
MANKIYYNNTTKEIEVIDFYKRENTLLSEKLFESKEEVIDFLVANITQKDLDPNNPRIPNKLKSCINEYLKKLEYKFYSILDWS